MTQRRGRSSRLVSYSLALTGAGPSPNLIRQMEVSWSSLRRHNPSVPVVLFMHGTLPPVVAELANTFGLMVDIGPSYRDRLRSHTPTGAAALATYPTLHKFLNHERLATSGAQQVLCCDLDTVFADDVDRLFDRYRHAASVVAREEVSCRRSRYPDDPAFIDEALLSQLAGSITGRAAPPFNLGAVLLNDPHWPSLITAERRFIDLAWRFAVWMALHPNGPGARFADFVGTAEARHNMTEADRSRALRYPSDNPWILDEVALWLAYGAVPSLSFADFAPADVAQNGEFAASDPANPGWTMCHYFSSSQTDVERWMSAVPA